MSRVVAITLVLACAMTSVSRADDAEAPLASPEESPGPKEQLAPCNVRELTLLPAPPLPSASTGGHAERSERFIGESRGSRQNRRTYTHPAR